MPALAPTALDEPVPAGAFVDLRPGSTRQPWPLTVVLGLGLLATADWLFDFPARAWGVWRPA